MINTVLGWEISISAEHNLRTWANSLELAWRQVATEQRNQSDISLIPPGTFFKYFDTSTWQAKG